MASDAAPAADLTAPARPYAWYALGVMVTVYAFNFVDRQIISILAEDIKASLKLSDAQLGVSLRHRFCDFLHDLRHPPRSALRQLVPRPLDGARDWLSGR